MDFFGRKRRKQELKKADDLTRKVRENSKQYRSRESRSLDDDEITTSPVTGAVFAPGGTLDPSTYGTYEYDGKDSDSTDTSSSDTSSTDSSYSSGSDSSYSSGSDSSSYDSGGSGGSDAF